MSAKSFHNSPNDDAPLYDSNGAPFYHQPNLNIHDDISVLGEGELPAGASLVSIACDHPGSMADLTLSGVKTPRAASPAPRPGLTRRATSQPPPATKSVQFALDSPPSPAPSSPKRKGKSRQRANSSNDKHDKEYSSDASVTSDRDDRTYRRRPRERPPSPTSSDSTEDLPARFDDRGRKMGEEDDDNPLFNKIDEFLGGKGSTGKILESLGLGGGGSDDDSRAGSGRGGARRKRRR